uniref:Latent-transforming growth factor beta-binding protein 2 n=1 Tax=Oryzias sinensis TaxID=183150 RepID=A0A8C7Y609_9TELE
SNRTHSSDCQPPCQNRGSCSRPHTCVCRSGFQGPRCEDVVPEQVYIRERGTLRRIEPGNNPFQRDRPQRRRDPLDSSPQHSGTSRTVKRYPSSSGPITSNALPSTNGNAHSQVCVCLSGANLTSNLDRIKIVFTPMMCNRVCNAGRCYNNCEKGDITTVYSEASQQQQQQQPSKIFCQIPCLNGGRCIGRDLCWCPSNSTGKFCHLAAPPPARPTPHSRTLTARHGAKSPSQSMYTLPLSNQQVSLHPSLVNVHIQHPPEAEVQVHQVARVQPGQRLANTEGVHSVQQRSQPGNGHEHPSEHGSRQFPSSRHENGHARTHSRQNEIVGRCFQETVDGQCGKPLPGLTKQDDCCGSIGASWGLNKCQKCPTKPAYAVIANGQVQCPKGFKRMNATHCQDINECLLPGICKNADCVNTKGSYRCTCKPGYMLDAARSHCVSDKAVSEERASCYRSVSSGFCSLPLANHLTKQICCCSRVGKAWGHGCDRCPLPGSDHFKEICPAGHGYTYSRSDVQISVRQLEDDELQSTGVSLEEQYPQFPSSQPSLLFPSEPQHPSYPQTPQAPQYPDYHNISTPSICGRGKCISVQTGYTCLCDPGFKLSALRTNYVNECDEDPCEGKGHCINSYGSYTCQCHSGYSQVITQNRKFCQDINECSMPNKCQNGNCVNTEGSYTCECNSGFFFSVLPSACADLDECKDPSSCPRGICINTLGSFQCQACSPGLRLSNERCVDIDECARGDMCLGGVCANTEGSFICTRCTAGYRVSLDQQSCEDIDECQSISTCANGICLNSEGSYSCEHCPAGYRVSHDGEFCKDIDECALPTTCPKGTCTNTEGSYMCVICQPGFRVSEDGQQCDGEDFVQHPLSYSVVENTGVLTFLIFYGPHIIIGEICLFEAMVCALMGPCVCLSDVNECLGSSVCPGQMCLNTQGSYTCRSCQTGFQLSEDGHTCQDVDECNNDNVCVRGQCINTYGSFLCLCEAGFKFSVDTADCDDQDECKEFGSSVCGAWRCQNTIGSYSCLSILNCGHLLLCFPITDKCDSEINCGEHGFCENTNSSFHCKCDKGYTNPVGDVTQCVDVNECETSSALCGEALCENYDGSFLCICPTDNEEFDPITNRCRSMAMIDPEHVYPAIPSTDERKECYYNLNDANYCNNVLSRNTTKQECCCTAGAGWGDNCEIHTCPLPGKDDYNQALFWQFFPPLRSITIVQISSSDANECEMFGSEICKNGQCSNIFSTYTCFCRSGYYYDNIRFECVDFDECQFGNTCENGACVNTAGSFNCFCSPPLVLDDSQRHCISLNSTEDVHEDICWQRLEGDNMCADPHSEPRTTFTECCCLHGVAWSGQCAFCPSKDSGEWQHVQIDRQSETPGIYRGSDSLRDQIGVEYGPEGPPYWNNYGGPAGTYDNSESTFTFILRYSPFNFFSHIFVQSVQHNAFEGLQAEECGILNGCENGRCVRVQEGYTCDCFDGYELDLSKMACVDINECEDISDKVPLCHNGQCTNTEGSYKCTCFAGFVASAKPHTCIPTIPDPKTRDSEN